MYDPAARYTAVLMGQYVCSRSRYAPSGIGGGALDANLRARTRYCAASPSSESGALLVLELRSGRGRRSVESAAAIGTVGSAGCASGEPMGVLCGDGMSWWCNEVGEREASLSGGWSVLASTRVGRRGVVGLLQGGVRGAEAIWRMSESTVAVRSLSAARGVRVEMSMSEGFEGIVSGSSREACEGRSTPLSSEGQGLVGGTAWRESSGEASLQAASSGGGVCIIEVEDLDEASGGHEKPCRRL